MAIKRFSRPFFQPWTVRPNREPPVNNLMCWRHFAFKKTSSGAVERTKLCFHYIVAIQSYLNLLANVLKYNNDKVIKFRMMLHCDTQFLFIYLFFY